MVISGRLTLVLRREGGCNPPVIFWYQLFLTTERLYVIFTNLGDVVWVGESSKSLVGVGGVVKLHDSYFGYNKNI